MGDRMNRKSTLLIAGLLGVVGALSVASAYAVTPQSPVAWGERWKKLPATPAPVAALKSGYASVNGIQLYYATAGEGEPVVLLHGGLANSDYWGQQVAALAQHHKVIVVVSRGHGRCTRAHRRIDADRAIQPFRTNNFSVQRFSHAVQALKFIGLSREIRSCQGVNAGQGLRVVRCKLWENGVWSSQKLLGAGNVGNVGMDLLREERKILHPIDLGTFDFTVPIGTLNQSDHQAVICATGQINHPVEYEWCALLISLNNEANALPVFQGWVETKRFQQVQRELQPVCLFSVNVEADVIVTGKARKCCQARAQLGENAFPLEAVIARMKCRQLD